MRSNILVLGMLCACLAGCFTVRESPYPDVVIGALPQGKSVGIQLSGFEAYVTSYVPVYGYSTVVGGSPWCGSRHHYHHYHSATMMTETFVPQTRSTPVYLERASEALERSGCILQTTNPQYRVEVSFTGPYTEDGDGWATVGWMVCTLFTAEFGSQNWNAKLKIYDVGTGKLVFFRDYVQRYEAVVWGPIPLFSPAGSDKTSESVMQGWCLTALTDRAVADVMNFINENK